MNKKNGIKNWGRNIGCGLFIGGWAAGAGAVLGQSHVTALQDTNGNLIEPVPNFTITNGETLTGGGLTNLVHYFQTNQASGAWTLLSTNGHLTMVDEVDTTVRFGTNGVFWVKQTNGQMLYLTNGNLTISGVFTGNGSGLTNIAGTTIPAYYLTNNQAGPAALAGGLTVAGGTSVAGGLVSSNNLNGMATNTANYAQTTNSGWTGSTNFDNYHVTTNNQYVNQFLYAKALIATNGLTSLGLAILQGGGFLGGAYDIGGPIFLTNGLTINSGGLNIVSGGATVGGNVTASNTVAVVSATATNQFSPTNLVILKSGATNFLADPSGNVSIAGQYNGNGAGLTNLPITAPSAWTNVTTFSDNFSGTLATQWQAQGPALYSFSGGQLLVNGSGSSTYGQYLVASNYFTAADCFVESCYLNVTGNTNSAFNSFAIGLRSGFPLQESGGFSSDQNFFGVFCTAASGYVGGCSIYAGSSNSLNNVAAVATSTSVTGSYIPINTNQWYFVQLTKMHDVATVVISNIVTGAFTRQSYAFVPYNTTYTVGFASHPALWIGGNGQYAVTNFTFSVGSYWPCDVVLVGDSITWGVGVTNVWNSWASLLKRQHPRAIAESAQSGLTSSNITYLLPELTNAYNPAKGWNVAIGVNDVAYGYTLAQSAAAFATISNGLAGTGKPIKWCLPTPLASTDVSPLANWFETNMPHGSTIDTYRPFLTVTSLTENSVFYFTDNIHLNEFVGDPLYFQQVESAWYGDSP